MWVRFDFEFGLMFGLRVDLGFDLKVTERYVSDLNSEGVLEKARVLGSEARVILLLNMLNRSLIVR